MTPQFEHFTIAKPAPLPAATILRLALQRESVRFCHWKSNHHLAEALAGKTDIDLFVAPADQAAFARVAVETGALKILSQPWGRYPNVEDWLLLDEATGNFLHLHVHYALMTGLKRVKHLQIPWENALLSHLRNDLSSDWPIPSAEMELLILLVRIWAKMPPWRRFVSPEIPSHIAKELDWLRHDANPEELIALSRELKLCIDQSSLLKLLKNEPAPSDDIIRVARELNRNMRTQYRMPWLVALAIAAVLNVRLMFAKAGRRMGRASQLGKTLPGGSMMIAFVGSDGSGKSTLTRDVQKWLRYKLDAHTFYMGSGDGGAGLFDILRRGIKGFVKSAGSRKKGSGGRNSKKTREANFFSKLVQLHQLVVMRHKLRLLRLARRMLKKGSVVITDRYPQGQFYGISDGPKLQDGRSFLWAARAELKLYEEASRLGPDLLLKLSIDPHTAHRRKPDHNLSVIERKCAIIDQLSFPQSRVVVIDAHQPYGDVLLRTKRTIWSALRRNQT
ncbi:MAG TPA: hypothetical protein VM144_03345 [Aestuariivirga sp.]|nr:hypothetical protein [Aestuariivirga sp.]